MPTVSLATVISDGMSVIANFGPYLGIGLALIVGPRLLKMGVSFIKGR